MSMNFHVCLPVLNLCEPRTSSQALEISVWNCFPIQTFKHTRSLSNRLTRKHDGDDRTGSYYIVLQASVSVADCVCSAFLAA